MTYEEAIEMLVNATYSEEWQGNEKLTKAHCMAIDALEKRIPKKVENKGYLGRINAENIYYGKCPACGKAVGSASCKKWCDQCGQSLKWGDKE